MIKIITDSTSDMGLDQAKKEDIGIVCLKVIMDKKEYKDRVDLKPEQFYDLLETLDTLPTTSQPSPQDFLTIYQEAKEKKEDVLVITLSSVLSGTYQSACIAKDLVDYENIYILDSLNATQGLHILVEKAMQLKKAGKSFQEMISFLEEYKKRICIFGIVDTLEYFYKGGRLSKLSATTGSLLKFKPILGLRNGTLDVFAKARGTQKATLKLIDLIKETGGIDLDEPIVLGYTGNHTDMEKFETTLKEAFSFDQPLYGIVGPVIGTHAGPGARLIAYVKKVQ